MVLKLWHLETNAATLLWPATREKKAVSFIVLAGICLFMYPITHPQLKAVSDWVPRVECLVKLHSCRYRTYPSRSTWWQSIPSILPISCNVPASLIKALKVQDHSHPISQDGKNSVMPERVSKWTSMHHEAQPGRDAPTQINFYSPPRRRTIYLWGHPSPDVTLFQGN